VIPRSGDIDRLYEQDIVARGKEQALWVLVAFLITFIVVRVITHAIRDDKGPFKNLRVGSTHIHHLVPGIFLLLAAGYLANAFHLQAMRNVVAVLFGVGAALTLDEFALWLHLKDVYWQKEGRRSIDAVVVAASIGGIAVLGLGFLRDLVEILMR
jgi:hypothetical protein